MSTKVTIKSRQASTDGPGFRLYEDVLDGFGKEDADDPPVYLHLDRVEVTLQTLDTGGASMTVTLPRELARALGLLPSTPGRA